MDQYLDMSSYVASGCKVCYHHLNSIWKKSLVSHQRGYENLGSCHGYFKVGLLQLITIWKYQYLITKLQSIQKAAARLILRCHRTTHTAPVLKELHWLPIKDRIIFSVVVNVFKALHGQSPQYIRNLLCYEEKTRFTSSSGKSLLKIPKWNHKTCGRRSFSVAGPYEWNRLPLYLRQKDTFKDLKKDLKTYLFRKSYQWCIYQFIYVYIVSLVFIFLNCKAHRACCIRFCAIEVF